MTPKKHAISIEKLSHFKCGSCKKWWTVGDAPLSKKIWYCPWCGVRAVFDKRIGK